MTVKISHFFHEKFLEGIRKRILRGNVRKTVEELEEMISSPRIGILPEYPDAVEIGGVREREDYASAVIAVYNSAFLGTIAEETVGPSTHYSDFFRQEFLKRTRI